MSNYCVLIVVITLLFVLWLSLFRLYEYILPCFAGLLMTRNRCEMFPSLLIGTSIYIYLLLLFATQRSRGENAFHIVFQEIWVFSHSSRNPTLAATGLGEDMVSSLEKTSLLENHVKCISYSNISRIVFLTRYMAWLCRTSNNNTRRGRVFRHTSISPFAL